MRTFKEEDILYIETSGKPHRLVLHLKKGEIEYYGKIKEAESFGKEFVKCHRTTIANKRNIVSINRKDLEIKISDGSVIKASVRGINRCIRDSI